MSRRTGVILFVAFAALFVLVNRPAYKGYFTDDDFDNLSWTRQAPVSSFVAGLLTPKFQTNNFRPAGHLFYREEGRWFGFDFPKYLAATHALHFLNVWLLWLLVRKLGAKPFAAAAGCAFYAFHPGYFEAVWKPSYIFDVLCATFCLVSLLSYVRGRWILSFVSFLLAYKSKELAVMLPFVLAAYELWYGQKRWKRLAPFLAISAWFALQALVLAPNGGPGNGYAFDFSVGTLAITSAFYAGRVFLVPYLGFAVPIAAWFSEDRRIRFGTAATILFLTPVLFLPGRIETGYCYLPFTGLAIVLSAAAEMLHPAWIVAGLVLFAPWELHDLRIERRDKLARDGYARAWVSTWRKFAAVGTPVDAFVWNGTPYGFGGFGVEGAIKCLYPGTGYQIRYYEKPPAANDGKRDVALTWNQGLLRLDIVRHDANTPDAWYIDANTGTPVWQLTEGWSNPEGGFRWIAPYTTALLDRPAGASHFELRLLASGARMEGGPLTVQVSVNGAGLAPRRVTQAGWQTLDWDLPAAPAGSANIAIRTDPPFHPGGDPRALGIAVGAFGFRD
jgi:hypothetical protein